MEHGVVGADQLDSVLAVDRLRSGIDAADVGLSNTCHGNFRKAVPPADGYLEGEAVSRRAGPKNVATRQVLCGGVQSHVRWPGLLATPLCKIGSPRHPSAVPSIPQQGDINEALRGVKVPDVVISSGRRPGTDRGVVLPQHLILSIGILLRSADDEIGQPEISKARKMLAGVGFVHGLGTLDPGRQRIKGFHYITAHTLDRVAGNCSVARFHDHRAVRHEVSARTQLHLQRVGRLPDDLRLFRAAGAGGIALGELPCVHEERRGGVGDIIHLVRQIVLAVEDGCLRCFDSVQHERERLRVHHHLLRVNIRHVLLQDDPKPADVLVSRDGQHGELIDVLISGAASKESRGCRSHDSDGRRL